MSLRTKRVRRTNKQVLKHGNSAKRKHRRVGGRTGRIRSKSTPAKHYGEGTITSLPLRLPNPPPWLYLTSGFIQPVNATHNEIDQRAWRKDVGDSLPILAAQLSDRGFAIELTPSMGVEYPGPFIEGYFVDTDRLWIGVKLSTIKEEPLILEIVDHVPNPSKALIPNHTTTYYRLLKTVDAFLAGLRRR